MADVLSPPSLPIAAAQSQRRPASTARLTVPPPALVCGSSTRIMLTGELRRLSWSPDGLYLHVQTIERDALRDYRRRGRRTRESASRSVSLNGRPRNAGRGSPISPRPAIPSLQIGSHREAVNGRGRRRSPADSRTAAHRRSINAIRTTPSRSEVVAEAARRRSRLFPQRGRLRRDHVTGGDRRGAARSSFPTQRAPHPSSIVRNAQKAVAGDERRAAAGVVAGRPRVAFLQKDGRRKSPRDGHVRSARPPS